MIMKTEKKGIALISVIVAIMILLLISGLTAYIGSDIIAQSKQTMFAKDLDIISDAIEEYYLTNGSIPSMQGGTILGVSDYIEKIRTLKGDDAAASLQAEIVYNQDLGATFYEVDIAKIGIEEAKFGLKENENDIFLISSSTHTIYYLPGNKVNGKMYYSNAGILGNIPKNLELTEQTIAKKITNLGVPIGATVEGYEDTLTWKYMGTDESGNALIVADVAENMTTVQLYGKDGYLNGPAKLDAKCDELYSSSMGTARNIKMEDITRVLKYDGPKLRYVDPEGKYIYTQNPMLIKDLEETYFRLVSRLGPNNDDVETYTANFFAFSLTSNYIQAGSVEKDLVHQENQYFFSTNYVSVNFKDSQVTFGIVKFSDGANWGLELYGSRNYQVEQTLSIRPVVVLSNDIQPSYDKINNVVTLKYSPSDTMITFNIDGIWQFSVKNGTTWKQFVEGKLYSDYIESIDDFRIIDFSDGISVIRYNNYDTGGGCDEHYILKEDINIANDSTQEMLEKAESFCKVDELIKNDTTYFSPLNRSLGAGL